jgi:hypothetical protein
MKATTPWITYRTRFLVKAKQLTNSLSFTDALGRYHSGRKGDYLVESSDGVLRIAPRQIFEDIYVPLLASEISEAIDTSSSRETLPSHQTSQPNLPMPNAAMNFPANFSLSARKLPQPERNRRNQIPGFQSL